MYHIITFTAVEQITVAAGTFECFKVVKYDDGGTHQGTFWFSEEMKREVKWIDQNMGVIAELKSYSV